MNNSFLHDVFSDLFSLHMRCIIGIDTTILPRDFDKWTLISFPESSYNEYIKPGEYPMEFVIESWTDNIFIKFGVNKYEFAKGRYFIPIIPGILDDVKIKYAQDMKIYVRPKDEYGSKSQRTDLLYLSVIVDTVFYLNLNLSSQNEPDEKGYLISIGGVYGFRNFCNFHKRMSSDEFYSILINKLKICKKAKYLFVQNHMYKKCSLYEQKYITSNIALKIENNLIEQKVLNELDELDKSGKLDNFDDFDDFDNLASLLDKEEYIIKLINIIDDYVPAVKLF